MTIRKKLVLSIATIGLILGLTLSVIIFFYLENIFIGQKIESLIQIGNEQEHESLALFQNNLLMAKMLGTRTRVKEFLADQSEARGTELLGIFSEYDNEAQSILAIYLLNQEGTALISTDPRLVGQNYSFRDYFKVAQVGQKAVNTYLGVTTNTFGYYFSYPVLDSNGSLLGVLMVKTDGSDISNSIVQSEISKSGVAMLVDASGVVITSSKPDRFLKSLGPLTENEIAKIKTEQRYGDKEMGSLQYGPVLDLIHQYSKPVTIDFWDSVDADREIVSVQKIGDFNYYLVQEIQLEKIEGTVASTTLIVSMLAFGSIVVILGVLYLVLTILLKPLRKFKQAVSKIGEGDFSQRMIINTSDEFNDFAQVFNIMSENISNMYQRTEAEVQSKTLEVQSKKEALEQQRSAILNVLEDIEEEKKTIESLVSDLEKFKLAVENHIVITDEDGKIVYANQAVKTITGFDPASILGMKAGNKELWGGQMPHDFYVELWDTIKISKKVFSGEVNNVRKNGEKYIAAVSISPIFDRDGSVQFFIGIERDVTKEREVDLAKTEFVSLASHQLRTPLSAINWYAEMLMDGDAGKLSKKQKQFIDEIYIGNQRMVSLVNALLNVSRLELGTFMVEPVPTNILALSDGVIKEMEPQIKSKKLNVSTKYEPNFPEVMVDPQLMRIVLQNLVSNAVKYTPEEGGIKISIGKDAENMIIKVKDTGLGIPVTQQDKIFEKLFRADNVKRSAIEGTGLGLYIIKSIMEHSGGVISFKSEENKGSEFVISMPLKGMKKKEGTRKLD